MNTRPDRNDKETETDLIDVLYDAVASLPYRIVLLWAALTAGHMAGIIIVTEMDDAFSDLAWKLIVMPVSLIFGAAHMFYQAPWAAPIVLFSWFLIFRGLYRMIAGRKPYSTFCELAFGSYLLTLGSSERWWIGACATAVMLIIFYKLPAAKRWREREKEYDTDGI